jgi:hypothetical protein
MKKVILASVSVLGLGMVGGCNAEAYALFGGVGAALVGGLVAFGATILRIFGVQV